MASITLTIPNAIVPRVLNGFCSNQGYTPILEDGQPNPKTQQQFIKRKIMEYVKNAVRADEIEKARNLAATNAGTSADTDIVLS